MGEPPAGPARELRGGGRDHVRQATRGRQTPRLAGTRAPHPLTGTQGAELPRLSGPFPVRAQVGGGSHPHWRRALRRQGSVSVRAFVGDLAGREPRYTGRTRSHYRPRARWPHSAQRLCPAPPFRGSTPGTQASMRRSPLITYSLPLITSSWSNGCGTVSCQWGVVWRQQQRFKITLPRPSTVP